MLIVSSTLTSARSSSSTSITIFFNWSLYMQCHTPLLWKSVLQCGAYMFSSQSFRLVLKYRSPPWLKHPNCDKCCLLSNIPHAVKSLCGMYQHVGVSEYVASIVLKHFKILSFLHNSILIFDEVIIPRLICKYCMNFYLWFLDQKEMAWLNFFWNNRTINQIIYFKR